MSTWWVTVILHIFSLFHALYPNNLSRCLAISMENGTGSISGPSSLKVSGGLNYHLESSFKVSQISMF